jgi:hypothetical protein
MASTQPIKTRKRESNFCKVKKDVNGDTGETGRTSSNYSGYLFGEFTVRVSAIQARQGKNNNPAKRDEEGGLSVVLEGKRKHDRADSDHTWMKT